MAEFFSKFWLSSSVGLLIGLAAVVWVRPTTSAGSVLLIAICLFVCVLFGQIFASFYRGKSDIGYTTMTNLTTDGQSPTEAENEQVADNSKKELNRKE